MKRSWILRAVRKTSVIGSWTMLVGVALAAHATAADQRPGGTAGHSRRGHSGQLRHRLVHFDYNCILPLTDPKWEKTHAESVFGAVERYGFDKALFFDCRKDLDGAVASIAKAVNVSTAEEPLYLIIAGPMEVSYLGIQRADPTKRQFVYCISHSRWNDGFASKYKFTFTKRVEPASVFVLTLKQAEDGDGTIIRLMETAGKAATANLTLPQLTIQNACRTNLVEENQGELASAPHQITVPLRPFRTATIRVRSR